MGGNGDARSIAGKRNIIPCLKVRLCIASAQGLGGSAVHGGRDALERGIRLGEALPAGCVQAIRNGRCGVICFYGGGFRAFPVHKLHGASVFHGIYRNSGIIFHRPGSVIDSCAYIVDVGRIRSGRAAACHIPDDVSAVIQAGRGEFHILGAVCCAALDRNAAVIYRGPPGGDASCITQTDVFGKLHMESAVIRDDPDISISQVGRSTAYDIQCLARFLIDGRDVITFEGKPLVQGIRIGFCRIGNGLQLVFCRRLTGNGRRIVDIPGAVGKVIDRAASCHRHGAGFDIAGRAVDYDLVSGRNLSGRAVDGNGFCLPFRRGRIAQSNMVIEVDVAGLCARLRIRRISESRILSVFKSRILLIDGVIQLFHVDRIGIRFAFGHAGDLVPAVIKARGREGDGVSFPGNRDARRRHSCISGCNGSKFRILAHDDGKTVTCIILFHAEISVRYAGGYIRESASDGKGGAQIPVDRTSIIPHKIKTGGLHALHGASQITHVHSAPGIIGDCIGKLCCKVRPCLIVNIRCDMGHLLCPRIDAGRRQADDLIP